MKNQVRAFFAVEISPEVRSNIVRYVRTLTSYYLGTKWVESGNLHLTLKFLGDVALNELPKILNTAKNAVVASQTFELECFGSGAFPNEKAPRTIWVGCRRGAEELTRLAENLDEALHGIGFSKESRRFLPHLTIGRVKRPDAAADMAGAGWKRMCEEVFGVFPVEEIVLFSSELTRRGPIYDELGTISLS